MSAISKKQQEQAAIEMPSQMSRSSSLIGANLRRAYDDVANEPLPERLSELLEQLKRGET